MKYEVRSTKRTAIGACVAAVVASVSLTLAQGQQPSASTLDRIRETGRIRFGYRADAPPFSYKTAAGRAAGYSIGLCQKVEDELRRELQRDALTVEWVVVPIDERFDALKQGRIDLLCAADTITLARRKEVAFSIPIFPGGVGALIRTDAPARLKEVLEGRGQVLRPTWRASASQVLQARSFSAVAGTTAEKWLNERITDLEVIVNEFPVQSYDAGVQRLLDRKSDALFGERAILMSAAKARATDVRVVDRLFTFEPLALAMARGNQDLQLVVDRALSRLYRSLQIGTVYASFFGEPDESAVTFFRWNALPD